MASDSSPPHRSRRSRYDGDDEYERENTDRRHNSNRSDRHRRDGDRGSPKDKHSTRHRRSRSPRSPDLRKRPRSRDLERPRENARDSQRIRSRDCSDRDRGDRKPGRTRDRRPETLDDDKRSKQVVRRNGPLPSQADQFAVNNGEEPPKEKEKPNYGITGALAAASNSIAQSDGSTIVLKYHEPPEARKPSPKDQWKLFVFKGADIIDTIELNHRTCWLVGRDLAVVDVAAEHPSISKQHAAIQFRYLEKRNEYGDKIGKVKPYLIDLQSANGTLVNSKKVPGSRYLELKDKDMIQFGQSTREYVLMLAPKE